MSMNKIFSIKQLDLVSIQKSIAKFVSDKYVIPACGFIKITGKEGSVEIEATNMEVSYKTTLKANFEEPFQLCVESKFIHALDKRDIELEFHLNDEICEIKYPGGLLRVLTMDAENYIRSVFIGEIICTVDSFELQNAITASIGISSDDRYSTIGASGVVLCADLDGLNVEAYNGIVCSSTVVVSDPEPTEKMLCQITNSASRFITSCLSGTIHVFKNNGVIIFSDGVSTLSIRAGILEIKSSYKTFLKNIKTSLDTTLKIVSKSFMISQINKASLFLKSDHNPALIIRLKDDVWEFVAGENQREMSVQQFPLGYKKQASDTIIVNYNFLVSILQRIKGEEFEIRIHSDCNGKVNKPIYITDGITDYLISVMS